MFRRLFGLMAVVGIVLLFIGSNYLVIQDELLEADAIIAVSGGDTEARVEEAIKLYDAGWAPTLIFSGAAADPKSISNAEAMRLLAIAEGVPESAILLEAFSGNTQENAVGVSSIVDTIEAKRVILVTSPYHQRRAFLEMRQSIDPDVEILNYPAGESGWGPYTWWMTPKGWYLTLSELPKTMVTSVRQNVLE